MAGSSRRDGGDAINDFLNGLEARKEKNTKENLRVLRNAGIVGAIAYVAQQNHRRAKKRR